MRAPTLTTICLSMALGLSGAAASAQHDHHGEHAAVVALTADQAGPALFSPSDLQFLHHMIVHHQQAIDMGALVPERTERDRLKRFARYVADEQRVEIRMMQGMLDMAAERGLAAPHHEMTGDPPMAGMLSSAEMAALAASGGDEFERLWLEGMIFHHEGGIAMARVQQLRQFNEGRRPPGLDVMVDHILEVQRAEITLMQRQLDDQDLATTADTRAPAAEVTGPGAMTAGRPVTIYGVAVDDDGIAGVDVAVQDLGDGTWLRSDGAWGERELVPATTIGSGPGAAWSFAFSPPPAGRYAVTAEAEDAAGKRTASEPLEFAIP